MFLLGGTLTFNEVQIDEGERRHLNKQLYSFSGFFVPYILCLAKFITKSMLIISISMELLLNRFIKTSIVNENVNVIPIRHRNNHISYTESNSTFNRLDS